MDLYALAGWMAVATILLTVGVGTALEIRDRRRQKREQIARMRKEQLITQAEQIARAAWYGDEGALI